MTYAGKPLYHYAHEAADESSATTSSSTAATGGSSARRQTPALSGIGSAALADQGRHGRCNAGYLAALVREAHAAAGFAPTACNALTRRRHGHFVSPLVSPSPFKRRCRAKAQRNHNPRVGGSSPSSGMIGTARKLRAVRVLEPIPPRQSVGSGVSSEPQRAAESGSVGGRGRQPKTTTQVVMVVRKTKSVPYRPVVRHSREGARKLPGRRRANCSTPSIRSIASRSASRSTAARADRTSASSTGPTSPSLRRGLATTCPATGYICVRWRTTVAARARSEPADGSPMAPQLRTVLLEEWQRQGRPTVGRICTRSVLSGTSGP